MGGRTATRVLAAALLAAALLAGCTVNTAHTTVTGSGSVAKATRSVSGFNAVTLNGVGSLTITQGGTESLTIEAEDNLLPLLQSNVAGQRLTLGPPDRTTLVPTRPIAYTLAVKALQSLDLNGAGTIAAALALLLAGGVLLVIARRRRDVL